MVPSLRKTHRRIWILLAVVLPVLYIAAILVIPDEVTQEKLYQDETLEQTPQENMEESTKNSNDE